TINLARIGYTSQSKPDFLHRLEELLLIARDSLEIKRKILEHYTQGNLYPYTKFYLRKIKSQSGTYWKNHFSTIGVIGMNEALLNLLGKDIGSINGKQFAEEVLDFIREKLLNFQEQTGNFYNLEATPAEGTSYRLALLDQQAFNDCHFVNGRGRQVANPFYTNSTHLTVNYSEDVFEVLDLQDSLQTRYTGGTVLHFFLGERVSDPASVKTLVRKICENYHLPYFTLTPSFSICPNHGYLDGEVEKCGQCGESCEVYSRVVGYLRPVKQWNDGKKAEFKARKRYKLPV
ncbi:TPA: ribonucleoside triphosphate reductase, partial [candidate division WOR-3 bacterium]|nr:ribonucleoside triphosphate reductase [candidate division WOR-3 bacterium]